MELKNILALNIIIGFIFCTKAFPQYSDNGRKLTADAEFAVLDNILSTPLGDNLKDPKSYYLAAERMFLKWRRKGLEIWKSYPNDERIYTWFKQTLSNEGNNYHYWRNPEEAINSYLEKASHWAPYQADVNWEDLKEWEAEYPKIKESYLSRLKGSNEILAAKTNCLSSEIQRYFKLSRNLEFRGLEKLNLEPLKPMFLRLKEVLGKGIYAETDDMSELYRKNSVINTINYELLGGYRSFGLDVTDLVTFFSELKYLSGNQTNNGLTRWLNQSLNLLDIQKYPLVLQHSDVDGINFDLSDYSKNKVVLLDFWSLSCSSCIARMSYLKELYKKYQSYGFEVLSFCVAESKDKDKVEKIEKKVDAGWKTFLIGRSDNRDKNSSLAFQVWERYGFTSVPQLLLLDKQGKLILYNNELAAGECESIIIEALSISNE